MANVDKAHKGKTKPGGVIIAAYPNFTSLPTYRTPQDLLDLALIKLREEQGLRLKVDGTTLQDRIFRLHQRSDAYTGGPHGTILRVRDGGGVLITPQGRYDLDEGYWVYVPAGQKFKLEGSVVAGMNFRVYFAHTVRA